MKFKNLNLLLFFVLFLNQCVYAQPNIVEQLRELHKRKSQGLITEEEFERQKSNITESKRPEEKKKKTKKAHTNVEKKAHITAVDSVVVTGEYDSKFPLHAAVKNKDRAKLYKLLQSSDAQVNVFDDQGSTAWDLAYKIEDPTVSFDFCKMIKDAGGVSSKEIKEFAESKKAPSKQSSAIDESEELFSYLSDKYYYLLNIAVANFQTEYTKVCLELKNKIVDKLDSQKNTDGNLAGPLGVALIIFDILIPHTFQANLGNYTPFCGNAFDQGLRGPQANATYMVGVMNSIFESFKNKHGFFKNYKTARILNQWTTLQEIKEKEKDRTKSRSIRFLFNTDIKDFEKIYVFVVGVPNKGNGTAFNEGIYSVTSNTYVDLANVNVYGTGLAFFAVALK